MKATSLHRRLVTILLGLTLISWLLAVVVTAINAHFLIKNQIDHQLSEYMEMSLYMMNMVLENPSTAAYFEARNPATPVDEKRRRIPGFGSEGYEQAINLWIAKTQILVGESTPVFPAPVTEGFRDSRIVSGGEDTPWRILYRYERSHDAWLAVGLNLALAQNIRATTFTRALLPLLIILPVSVTILLIGIRRGLSPLNNLARKIAARKAFELEPIGLEEVPRELYPLVDSLNQLLERLQVMLTGEQRFTANAAHELQTPLTAIKAEVQRCQREVESDGARQMLSRISARVTRATVTVRQLLTLARLDPDQEIASQSVDLEQLLLEVVAEHGALAVDRQLEFNILQPKQPALINGNPDWINILLQNLVVNALNYACSPGVIDIQFVSENGNVILSIANDCAPIAAEDLQRMTQRFYRGSQNSHPGSGLGLSIAQRVTELHRGKLKLSHWHADGGFKAEVVFPGTL